MIHDEHNVERAALHRRLGLSSPAITLLAAIAAIRVPLHDLGIVPDGSVVAGLLVFVPLTVWLLVVLLRRVPNPFLALTVVGVAYGVMLAIIHQMLWGAAYHGNPPTLSGNLEGVLAPRPRGGCLSHLRLLQHHDRHFRGCSRRGSGLGDRALAANLTSCTRKEQSEKRSIS